jgi:hypothetical protein
MFLFVKLDADNRFLTSVSSALSGQDRKRSSEIDMPRLGIKPEYPV